MNRLFILMMFTYLIVGCRTHSHALLVTSAPSAQRFVIEGYNDDGRRVAPHNGNAGLTPYEVVFPERVYNARVTVTFSTGESQTKTVSFVHPRTTLKAHRVPILGVAVWLTDEVHIVPREVHFDQSPHDGSLPKERSSRAPRNKTR